MLKFCTTHVQLQLVFNSHVHVAFNLCLIPVQLAFNLRSTCVQLAFNFRLTRLKFVFSQHVSNLRSTPVEHVFHLLFKLSLTSFQFIVLVLAFDGSRDHLVSLCRIGMMESLPLAEKLKACIKRVTEQETQSLSDFPQTSRSWLSLTLNMIGFKLYCLLPSRTLPKAVDPQCFSKLWR